MFLKINIASADYLILTNGKVSANTNLIGPTAYRFETSINIGGVNYSLSLHYEAQEALLFSVILPSVCLFMHPSICPLLTVPPVMTLLSNWWSFVFSVPMHTLPRFISVHQQGSLYYLENDNKKWLQIWHDHVCQPPSNLICCWTSFVDFLGYGTV